MANSLENEILSEIFGGLENREGFKVFSQEQTDVLDADLANRLQIIKKEYEIKERNTIAYVTKMETRSMLTTKY